MEAKLWFTEEYFRECSFANRNRLRVPSAGKINIVCMCAFFRLSGVLPIDKAMSLLRESIINTYSVKGEDVVKKNLELLEGLLFDVFDSMFDRP